MNAPVAVMVVCGLLWMGYRKWAQAQNRATFEPGFRYNTAARGILLSVDVFSKRRRVGGVRAECRFMTVDVEIPGRAPFTIDAQVYFPPNLVRDILPGA